MKPCTTLSDGGQSDFLLMTNLVGAFYLLFVGYFLATLIFLLEQITHKWKQHGRNGKSNASKKNVTSKTTSVKHEDRTNL